MLRTYNQLISSCIYIDEHTNHLKIPHTSVQPVDDVFTISFWIFVTQNWNGKKRFILCKTNEQSESCVSVYLHPNTNKLCTSVLTTNGLELLESEHEIALHKWVHVAILKRKESLVIFVNGKLDCEKNVNGKLSWNRAPFHVGYHPTEKANLVCLLAELNFYSKELSVQEIVDIAKTTQPTMPSGSNPPQKLECKPLMNMEQLRNWKPENDPKSMRVPLHKRSEDRKQKVISCHDMMGGYLDDRWIQGGKDFHVYNFRYWQYVDIFIYFSHYTVSIPPPGWIDAAHKNGVKVLGTFITEWGPGVKNNLELLDGPKSDGTLQNKSPFDKFYADKLVQIAEHFGFDGWFFNIESSLPNEDYCIKMKEFLSYITKQMHEKIPGSIVLWYDSVISTGKVDWQNALNEKNKMFFDACDGIFLNYTWTPKHIQKSVEFAKDRKYDVYTGIDVFGRGCKGGYDTCESLKVIQEYDTSIALFAPGWTFENNLKNRIHFERSESKFWVGSTYQDLLSTTQSSINHINGWTILGNGGEGWKMNGDWNGDKVYATSSKPCRKYKLVDLQKAGVSVESQPTIFVQEWYKGAVPKYSGKYSLKVQLLDDKNNVIQDFETGELNATQQWQRITHIFYNYGTNVRYVYWEDGGSDVHLCGATLSIEEFSPRCVSTYVQERAVCENLPFVTTFNQGIGQKFFVNGKETMNATWNNMSQQDVQCTRDNEKVAGNKQALHSAISYEIAYQGGSSLRILGRFKKQDFTVFKLFDTNFKVQKGLSFSQTLLTTQNSDAYFALVMNDRSQIHLTTNPIQDNTLKIHTLKHSSQFDESNWITSVFDIPDSFAGKIIKEIRVVCSTKATKFDTSVLYEAYIGSVGLFSEIIKPTPILNLSATTSWNSRSIDLGMSMVDVNLQWEHENLHQVAFFEIYQGDKFVGRAYQPRFRVDDIVLNDSLTFSVNAVSTTWNRSKSVSVIVPK